MKILKHLCLSLAVLLMAATGRVAHAQAPAPSAGMSADKIVDSFFAYLGKGQVDQAYDFLTNGTKIAEKPDEVAKLKSTTKDAIRIFGDISGYELIATKTAGTHLMCSTYLSLGKGYPLRWKFYFYRWDKTWRLIDIRVDDRLVDIFDETIPAPKNSSGTDQ